MTPSLRDLMNIAADAAYAGGKSTLAHFCNGVAVERKADQTPVTVADRDAEHIIRNHIARYFPTHSFLGEEHGRTEGDPDFMWVIDPIDGTKSFIHGVPFYGAVVGCMVRNQPLVGAVYLPPLDQLLCAAEGLGATWNGRTCRVSSVKSLLECTLLSSSLITAMRRSDAFENLADQVRLTRGWGDVYGYMMVATGRAEIMLDARISLWDIAGVAPIVREAGGFFGNWAGESTVNGPDCAAIVPGVKDVVLDVLKCEKMK